MRNEQKIRTTLKNVTEHGWGVVDLKNCGLTEIPEELFNQNQIVFIDLSNSDFTEKSRRNRITEIPDKISNLQKLNRLNLQNNQIEKISPELSRIKSLKFLNLQNNRLKDIPEQIANMEQLQELKILGNPFDLLPPEIAGRGIDSIRNFYRELKEQDFIFEVKLIIVGEGRVGKTCISKALINPDFSLEEEESTEGIKINRWVIPKEEIEQVNGKINRDFQINIWDFGGQEIYHSTHQFFLTKRSIYLLITESRKEDSHDDFFYWLNIIKLLGNKSPVMMVLNKCDQPTKDLPVKEYQSSFSNIISFHKISLKDEFRDSFNKFKTALIKEASQLPHIGAPLPKVWVDIRRDIEEMKLSGKNFINRLEYLDICRNYYRREDSALFLSEYFHDLGVILHFQDDMELQDLVILNHEWLTKGVYKILDDQKVIDQNGRFTNEDIFRIWSNGEHRPKVRELISLMKNTKFDLCFEIKPGEYLVPRLLPVDEIEHSWTEAPSDSKFEFRYKFMPKGILARLIVKMNSDIHNNQYWRHGVVLQYEGTYALIREKYFESKISIELRGARKREFLFLIRKSINEIHKDFNKLEVQEMIPCNCEECSKSLSPHFYDFTLLRRYESKMIMNIRCDKSLEEVKVFDLTDDIAKRELTDEKVFICENQNATLFNTLGINNAIFIPEKDSASVFFKIKTKPEYYGIRDRDFLLDSEIEKIKAKYKNYFILNYYCFENYLYHPNNIEELEIRGFDKKKYKQLIVNQKNEKKNLIISNYKNARKSYQEFRIKEEELQDKKHENDIIKYLESDDIEVFFKAFSAKEYLKKEYLSKFQITQEKLASTTWFRVQITRLLDG
ncbi:MAG: hypothetical protein DHS20C13_25190 [Thermodesulfobacteriota bacterium]|nr:MAG: hypothetical protein DHS20C13_25190 [Thermodesulfobacteriota bacterium]GJM36326.1 MAG: hypothetical protein DHS20C18_53270 [Saprospiraceae bacterium]